MLRSTVEFNHYLVNRYVFTRDLVRLIVSPKYRYNWFHLSLPLLVGFSSLYSCHLFEFIAYRIIRTPLIRAIVEKALELGKPVLRYI